MYNSAHTDTHTHYGNATLSLWSCNTRRTSRWQWQAIHTNSTAIIRALNLFAYLMRSSSIVGAYMKLHAVHQIPWDSQAQHLLSIKFRYHWIQLIDQKRPHDCFRSWHGHSTSTTKLHHQLLHSLALLYAIHNLRYWFHLLTVYEGFSTHQTPFPSVVWPGSRPTGQSGLRLENILQSVVLASSTLKCSCISSDAHSASHHVHF